MRTAPLRVVQQFHDLACQIDRVVAPGIQGGALRRDPALHQVELDDRLGQRHVFHDLVHGRLVVHVVGDIRIDADVGGIQHVQQIRIRHAPGEGDVIGDAQLHRQLPHAAERGAAAHQPEMHVRAPHDPDDVPRSLQQNVDSFLRAHHADVADQIVPAALELRLWRHDAHALQLRAAAHHEYLAGIHAATFDRDPPIRFVGGDRHIRGLESPAFEPHHQAIEKIAPAELCLVQLGVDVVMVKDEFLAEEELEEAADQKQQIGRIAGLDDIEAARQQHAPGQDKSRCQCDAVFQQVAGRPLRLDWQVVAVDVDAIQALVPLLATLAGRADDRHPVAIRRERGGLLPHAPVEWRGQVFDQNQYPLFRGSLRRAAGRASAYPVKIDGGKQYPPQAAAAQQGNQPPVRRIQAQVILGCDAFGRGKHLR